LRAKSVTVIQADVFGSPNIGVYCFSNESLSIVPYGLTGKKIDRFSKCLGVDVCVTNLCASRLLGIFVAANSSGMVVPHLSLSHELEAIRSVADMNVEVLHSKVTAFGNIILVNDYGAVVDPRFSTQLIKKMSEIFRVKVVKGEICGLPYVGSMAVATNKGVLAHPSIKDDEKKLIEETLGVPVDSGTVNSGTPYVKAGLLANTRGAVVGPITTGPELMAITKALGTV